MKVAELINKICETLEIEKFDIKRDYVSKEEYEAYMDNTDSVEFIHGYNEKSNFTFERASFNREKCQKIGVGVTIETKIDNNLNKRIANLLMPIDNLETLPMSKIINKEFTDEDVLKLDVAPGLMFSFYTDMYDNEDNRLDTLSDKYYLYRISMDGHEVEVLEKPESPIMKI